jgi:hypothetical protein
MQRTIRRGIVLAMVSALLSFASAANATTYLVDRVIGAGTVKGYIETNGTTGPLGGVDITDWSLTLTGPLNTGSPYSMDFATALKTEANGSLIASATQLIYDFSVASDASWDIYFEGRSESANPFGEGNFWRLDNTGEYMGFAVNNTYAGSVTGQTGQVVLASVAATPLPATPLPAALPLFASGFGVIGLLARRRKRKAAATL